jgi:hypothetical protein
MLSPRDRIEISLLVFRDLLGVEVQGDEKLIVDECLGADPKQVEKLLYSNGRTTTRLKDAMSVPSDQGKQPVVRILARQLDEQNPEDGVVAVYGGCSRGNLSTRSVKYWLHNVNGSWTIIKRSVVRAS